MGDLEYQELGLALTRPRYNLRTRSQNKWVNSSNRSSGGSASMSSPPNFYQPPAPPPASDFVPAQQGDFSGNPAPSFETFDEVQPAVPPPVFDSSMEQPAVFDGSAEGMPPPPPPPDFEF